MYFTEYIDEELFFSGKKESLREGFGRSLALIGENNKNILAISADLTESTKMNYFKEKFPERFIEVGITEQFMAAFAAGLASAGKIPFISSYATFSPGRNWDQIRSTICYDNLPVKIVGSHAGVSVGPDGGTHQALEDIAMLRVLPNMEIYLPADAKESEYLTEYMATTKKPSYIRLARADTALFLSNKIKNTNTQPYLLWDQNKPDVLIVCAGPVCYEALSAVYELSQESISFKVLNLNKIKPINKEIILEHAKDVRFVVTVEEHQKTGGVYGAVSELLSEELPKQIIPIGINDRFGESGDADELIKYFGLDKESIKQSIKRQIQKY